ncbi:hypothetical protein ACJEDT_13115 [Rhodococcoides fascians]|uniref:hypothetical protein n=1 Tax=Rhodococcoides fascians TaxID=1828 RepID=UPI00389A0B36
MGHLKVDLLRMVVEYDGVETPITNEQVIYPPDMTKLTVVPASGGGGGGSSSPRASLDGRNGYPGGGGGQRPGDPDPSRIMYWNR